MDAGPRAVPPIEAVNPSLAPFREWLGVSGLILPPHFVFFQPLVIHALAAFAVVGVLLGLSLAGILGWFRREPAGAIPEDLLPLVAAAGVALAGFAITWVWFWSPRAGPWASCLFVGITAIAGLRRVLARSRRLAWLIPFGLAAAVGVFYLAVLFLHPQPTFSQTAANRFLRGLPMDNEFPRIFADRLIHHVEPRIIIGDWHVSDRPPLQTGWVLLFWPVLERLGFDLDTAAGAAGCWFQLLWCLALWGIARSFGLSRLKALAVVLGAVPIGLMLVNSVYVWPKLGAAAFLMGGVTLGFLADPPPPGSRAHVARFCIVGGLMGLAWLSHAGVAFSILGTAPLFLWRARSWRAWTAVGLTFLALAAPWLAYQRYCDPPGNRLMKWHLAGSIPVDDRPFLETLVQQYRSVGWRGAWEARRANFMFQNGGSWRHLLQPGAADFRRPQEFFFYLRSAGLYLPAGILAWLAILIQRRRPGLNYDRALLCAVWVLSSWAAWLGLMFIPFATVAHAGSYAIPLGLYALLLAGIVSELPLFSLAVIGAQCAYFLATWAPP